MNSFLFLKNESSFGSKLFHAKLSQCHLLRAVEALQELFDVCRHLALAIVTLKNRQKNLFNSNYYILWQSDWH